MRVRTACLRGLLAVASATVVVMVVGAASGPVAGASDRQLAAGYTQFPTLPFGATPSICAPVNAANPGQEAANAPIVSAALTTTAKGCWATGADGGVFAYGTAPFYGSMGGTHLAAPVVGMAATARGAGYWLVAADGGIFSFGNAGFYGSMGDARLNAPVVGMAADPATGGYWEVASDGGIFSFNVPFYGSMGGSHLNAPVVGMAATRTGGGYWLVAADGGVFTFGNATFYGSTAGHHLDTPVVGIAADPATGGYWLVTADGGVFSFDAPFYGSHGGAGPLPDPVTAIVATPGSTGYQLIPSDPAVEPGASGRSAYDLARRQWLYDGALTCSTEGLPLFQGAQYLLIAESDGGTTSGYGAAINELVQISGLPGMGGATPGKQEQRRLTAALNAFFGVTAGPVCG